MITQQMLLSELAYCYPDTDFTKISDDQVVEFFNTHCNTNSEEVNAIDLVNELTNTTFVIDTPDGWLTLGDFYIKSERPTY